MIWKKKRKKKKKRKEWHQNHFVNSDRLQGTIQDGFITVLQKISQHVVPVKPCLPDSPQTAVAAGKEGPRFFLLLLFSFWLCRLHFPKGRPLHMVLQSSERGEEKTVRTFTLQQDCILFPRCNVPFLSDES